MRLREHPKVDWPPAWAEWAERSQETEVGTLKESDLIERDQVGPTRLLLVSEFKGKARYAEVACNNTTFVRRLYEKVKPLCGREIKETGDLEIED